MTKHGLHGGRAMVQRVRDEIYEWLYPGVCRECGVGVRGGMVLCEACLANLADLEEPFCKHCSEPFPGKMGPEFHCPNCHRVKFSFQFARSGVPHSEIALELIHAFKYHRQIYCGRTVAALAARAFADERFRQCLAEQWILVPVPLHWRRHAWRRFNQAAEMAHWLGAEFHLKTVNALRRVRDTTAQARLHRRQRQQNLRGAFRLRRELTECPGVILVDDVFTTGSTVQECSKVLRRAGVEKVVVVTAMRG